MSWEELINEQQEEFNEHLESLELDPAELEVKFDELDIEWGKHSSLYEKYVNASAYCEKYAKKCHERVKQIRSELILDATKDPEGCLGPKMKPTGPNVEAYYRTQPNYLKAKEIMIEAEYTRDLITGQKSKAYGRKTILQEAAKLSMMGWFSSPLEPRSLSELVEKIKESTRADEDTQIRNSFEKRREMRRKRKA